MVFAALIAAGYRLVEISGALEGARTIGTNSGRTGSVAWPVALSFIGAPLALAGNFLAATVAWIGGSSHPWDVAAAWTPVWGSLSVYPSLILILVWRHRQEGFSFGELLAIRRSKLGVDLSLGLAISLGIALFAALAAVLMSEIYPEIGESLLRHANDSLAIPLPAWFFAWSVLVSPLGAALVEELTYRGYALPRLTAARLTPGMALWLTSLGFGLQHVAFPYIDLSISIYRCFAIFCVGIGLGWIYLKVGRLLPLIVGHYLWDAAPAVLAIGVLISHGR